MTRGRVNEKWRDNIVIDEKNKAQLFSKGEEKIELFHHTLGNLACKGGSCLGRHKSVFSSEKVF